MTQIQPICSFEQSSFITQSVCYETCSEIRAQPRVKIKFEYIFNFSQRSGFIIRSISMLLIS